MLTSTRVDVDLWWARTPEHPVEARAAGRRLLERAATARLGRQATVVRRCPRCGSEEHGRPVVPDAPDLGLSTSRTAGHVVVATVTGAGLGIDVEHVGTAVDRLAEVALGPQDASTVDDASVLRTWVRKEAVLKAAGTGLAVDPSDLAVSAATAPPTVVSWTSDVAPDPRPLVLVDLVVRHGLPDGLLGSLAVTGTSRGPDVVVRPRSAGR